MVLSGRLVAVGPLLKTKGGTEVSVDCQKIVPLTLGAYSGEASGTLRTQNQTNPETQMEGCRQVSHHAGR